MTTEEYYVAPPDAVFDSIKRAATALWMTFDDAYGYATGKVNRIKEIGNVRDNAAYMVAMFDGGNKRRLYAMLDNDDAKAYVQRLFDAETAAMLEMMRN